MTSGRRRVARSVGVLFVGETTAQALGFVLTAYLARVLGPAGFGVWIFATAVTLGASGLIAAIWLVRFD